MEAQLRRAVARIIPLDEGTRAGSAFAVTEIHALTAFHCVGRREGARVELEFESQPATAGSAARRAPTRIPAKAVRGDDQTDLAVLELERALPPGFAAVPWAEASGISGGTRFVAEGFGVQRPPGSSPHGIDGHVVRTTTLFDAPQTMLQLHSDQLAAGESAHGFSGGPVLVQRPAGGDGATEVAVAVVRWDQETDDRPGVAVGGDFYAIPICHASRLWPAFAAQFAARRVHVIASRGAPRRILKLPRPTAPCEGRERELDELEAGIERGGSAVVGRALVGLGGIGKTRLVLEFAHRVADRYRIVWWFNAEDVPTLKVALREFATALALEERESADEMVIATTIRDWLERHDQWLLVFDNAARTEEVLELIPYEPRARPVDRSSPGRRHVIVTSRYPRWQVLGEVIRLKPVDRPAAIRILQGGGDKRVIGSRIERRAAAEIAVRLGNFPLALAQAGAYMRNTGRSCEAYLRLLEESGLRVLEAPFSLNDYKHTVATTWQISIDAVRSCRSGGDRLLALAAFLAPDDVPRGAFVAGGAADAGSPAALFPDAMAEDFALATLNDLSLITFKADRAFSVHRLVQDVTRSSLDRGARIDACRAALAIVDAAFPADGSNPASWARCSALLPHALAAIHHADQLGEKVVPPARLHHKLGVYREARAEYEPARTHYEKAQELAGRESDHAGQAVAANSLGIVTWHLGAWPAARQHFELAERLLAGEDDPASLAASLNNLGLLVWDEGDWRSATTLFEKSLELLRPPAARLRGLAPRLAGTLRNLAHVHWDRARWHQAIAICEDSVEISEQAGYRRGVAQSLNSLGMVHWDIGLWGDARACHERALAALREEPDDVVKCGTFNCLGFVLSSAGDFDGPSGAFAAHERAGRLATKIGDHHGRAVALNNLGLSLLRRDEFGAAREAFEGARRLLGRLDVRASTVASLNGLGLAWAKEGQWDQAIACHRGAHDIARQFGAWQDQAVSGGDLGIVFASMGDLPSAFAQCEQALAIYRELDDVHGEATALNDYGIVCGNAGNWSAAADAFARSLPLRNTIDDRHGAAIVTNNLGVTAAYRGDSAAARDRCAEAAARFRSIGDRRYAAAASRNARGGTPTEPLETLRDLRDRHGEVFTLDNLGLVDAHRLEWPP